MDWLTATPTIAQVTPVRNATVAVSLTAVRVFKLIPLLHYLRCLID